MELIYSNDYRHNLEQYWRQFYPDWTIPAGYHVHHILPRACGGTNHPHNLIALHPDDHVTIHKCRGDKVQANFILSVCGRITWNKGLPPEEQPGYGYRHTAEHKLKVSSRQQGKTNSFYGKTHSTETRKKMSVQGKGRKWYNNGVRSSRFFPGTEPNDFVLGRYP